MGLGRYRWQRRVVMALVAWLGVLLSGVMAPGATMDCPLPPSTPQGCQLGGGEMGGGGTGGVGTVFSASAPINAPINALTSDAAASLSKQVQPKALTLSPWTLPPSQGGMHLKQQEDEPTLLLSVEGILDERDPILADNSRYDVYPFAGQAGQVITIRMESDAFDTYVLLVDGQNAIIGENDDGHGGDTNAILTLVLPTTGTYRVVANAYDRTGLGPYRLTVAIARETDAQRSQADQLYSQGTIYYEQYDYPQALQAWTEALALYQAVGATHQQGATADRLGAAHRAMGNYDQAIPFFEQALAIARELNFRQGETVSLGSLGNVYRVLGDYARSIELQQASLAIAREIGDLEEEAAALTGLGLAYGAIDDYPRAIETHEAALALTRELGDREGEANALGNLGNIYYTLGDYDQATDLQQQALAINRSIGDRQGEGITLGNLGLIYSAQGHYHQALALHQQQLAIAREIYHRQGESNAFGSLGQSYFSLGNYGEAIAYIQQQLAIARDIGFRQGEASALGNLGALHVVLGDYAQAIHFLQQHLEISQVIGDRAGESSALGNLGNVYLYQEQPEQALQAYQQSLAISRAIGDRAGEADSLGNIGTIYATLEDYAQALRFYQQSLAIAEAVGDRPHEASTLVNVGNMHDELADHEQAIATYRQSLAIAQAIGDRRVEALTLNNLGSTLFNTGALAEAETTLRAAITIYESQREGLSDSQRVSFLETQATTYQRLQEVLNAQSKSLEALVISEQGRAQAFALQLAQRVNTMPDLIQSLQVATQAPDIDQIRHIARDQNTTLVEYSLIGQRLLYVWVVAPTGDIQFRSVDLTAQNSAQTDDPATATTNPIADFEPPVDRGDTGGLGVDELVGDLRSRGIGIVAAEPGTPPQLNALYQLLIDPIADLLPADPTAKVAFIPQSSLFLVPFAALRGADDTYLIEQHTILTAPSIQVLGLANAHQDNAHQDNAHQDPEMGNQATAQQWQIFQNGDALVVGNPVMPKVWLPRNGTLEEVQLAPLPGTEAEALAIGTVLNSSPLIGDQATEATIKQRLPSTPLIHLATHGLLEYGDPQASGVLDLPGAVALTPGEGEDGLLTAAEILEMDLSAQLAILSACDTGRGRITGDGVVGLSRSLMAAGVPSVIVSLWAVPDAPTAALMTAFYRQLDAGHTIVQALRQAMLETMGQYPEPVNWAAFTLMGAA